MRRTILVVLIAAAAVGGLYAVTRRAEGPPPAAFPAAPAADEPEPAGPSAVATFGSGCFWCTEAVFRQVRGVTAAVSGYSGGAAADATYERVCSGATGHAEAVQVTFDPAVVTYAELLEVFWRSHDPTTPDRQGPDAGPQYRSVVFAHTDRQRRLAERYKAALDAAGVYPAPVVTAVVPFGAFYPAEAYHQDYFAANPRRPYCRAVIGPKVEKLRAVFADKVAPARR